MSIQALKAAITDWLVAHGMGRDIHLYSQEEWLIRGEDMCPDSLLSIVFDGAHQFYSLMNFSLEGQEGDELYESWRLMLLHNGYTHEVGYAWSAHLYPA